MKTASHPGSFVKRQWATNEKCADHSYSRTIKVIVAFRCTRGKFNHFLRANITAGNFNRWLVRKNYYAKSFRTPRFFPDGRLKVPSESNLQIPSGASSSRGPHQSLPPSNEINQPSPRRFSSKSLGSDQNLNPQNPSASNDLNFFYRD